MAALLGEAALLFVPSHEWGQPVAPRDFDRLMSGQPVAPRDFDRLMSGYRRITLAAVLGDLCCMCVCSVELAWIATARRTCNK